MTRSELTVILLRFMEDDIRNLSDPKAFLESLDDQGFDSFARGYLLGVSVRLKRYEEIWGVRLTGSPE